ncbi:MAG: dynamin family protein [Candidatus Cloacimonetes bacterium]|nr:dynamin family protein [Candidatus Cloacimonadota bacterium]
MLDITKRQSFDILHQSIEGVNCENSIRVAFLGEFSTGKSTLVNALIKQRLIPMLDKPTNANPIEINAAYENSFEISRWVEDEEVLQVIQQDRLQDEVINYETGKRVYLHLKDCSILNNDVVLIDTPGISSLLEHHTDVTFGYLPIIDAAVFVISALPGSATNSVLDFIEEQISPIKGLKNRLFFCISMLDAIPPRIQRKKCVKRSNSLLKRLCKIRG